MAFFVIFGAMMQMSNVKIYFLIYSGDGGTLMSISLSLPLIFRCIIDICRNNRRFNLPFK